MKKFTTVSIYSELFDHTLGFVWHGGTGVNVYVDGKEVDYFNVQGITHDNVEEVCMEYLEAMEEEGI